MMDVIKFLVELALDMGWLERLGPPILVHPCHRDAMR